MGKGDIRTRRGKIWKGTFGKSRPARKQNKKQFPVAKTSASPETSANSVQQA
ncbi:30S ribosomal protein THX [Thermoflavifilum thermophilum]|uniref:Ribosomal small subunit protein bTHX n=1 Tax=Thermoflavifilum thermophilum TaxID=1393122 RepID=A0A1I7N8V2_9BACT|nr:30S ribosomal protein THX [Thermoflavifilum thermophilum]SFV31112.1 ribosomal small subunit protein bTHX [Thermoflavifilum thermophilum]